MYHGLPDDLHFAGGGRGDYLAFIGRIAEEKRPDRAIEIATRAGMKLKIAAKIDAVGREYLHRNIEPLLVNSLVNGLVTSMIVVNKNFSVMPLLWYPIDWPEPLGLVIIEALACGTPVIAFRRGAVAELIEDGVTGFIVDDIDQAVAAVAKVKDLVRRRCRQVFEKRFSVARRIRDYMQVYSRLIKDQPQSQSASELVAMMGG